jgi:hypothetical protein
MAKTEGHKVHRVPFLLETLHLDLAAVEPELKGAINARVTDFPHISKSLLAN